MSQFPIVSWKKLELFFGRHGFERKRKKGSHIVLKKDGIARPIIIPQHKEVKEAVIRRNLKTAGISREKFIEEFK